MSLEGAHAGADRANARINAAAAQDGDSAPDSSRSSMSYTRTYSTPATGAQTPDPLMGNTTVVNKVALHDLANKDFSNGHEPESYALDTQMKNRKPSVSVSRRRDDLSGEESASPIRGKQGIPPELPNFTAELVMIFVCSAGLMLLSLIHI